MLFSFYLAPSTGRVVRRKCRLRAFAAAMWLSVGAWQIYNINPERQGRDAKRANAHI